ncbi:gamma-glutamylcyclotransferase [Mesorhizobium sp. M0590]
MWVFGYGSLMWDGWQKKHGSGGAILAELPGYVRAFNKASILRWGTKADPGPTLNLVESDGGVCVGYAFEFPAAKKAEVLADLASREGKGFELRPMEVRLTGGQRVLAYTPVYIGKNLITGKSSVDLVAKARSARGVAGNCTDYILSIAEKLASLKISDKAVEDFASALEEH